MFPICTEYTCANGEKWKSMEEESLCFASSLNHDEDVGPFEGGGQNVFFMKSSVLFHICASLTGY